MSTSLKGKLTRNYIILSTIGCIVSNLIQTIEIAIMPNELGIILFLLGNNGVFVIGSHAWLADWQGEGLSSVPTMFDVPCRNVLLVNICLGIEWHRRSVWHLIDFYVWWYRYLFRLLNIDDCLSRFVIERVLISDRICTHFNGLLRLVDTTVFIHIL